MGLAPGVEALASKLQLSGGKQAPVRYEIQAHILNASELAPTSSNVVRVERR